MVGGEGLDRVACVRDDDQHAFHPLGVLLKRLQVGERFCLGREARARLAVGAAPGTALARLAGVEESSCRLGDGLSGSGHGVMTSPSCRLWAPGAEQEGYADALAPPSVRRLYAWKKPPATRRNSHNAGRLLTLRRRCAQECSTR